MQCPHFDVGECRSCPLMGVPYARQLADKQAAVLAALADAVDADTVVAEPFASAEAGFRNKAKLVVTGSAAPAWTCATAACTRPAWKACSTRARRR